MRHARSLALLLAAGCAGPFSDVKPTASAAQLTVTTCGNSGMRAASVIATMDGPPLGESGSQIEKPKEVTICLRIENQGDAPLTVDRSHLALKAPHERQGVVPDKDDTRFVVPPHDARKTQVTFNYSALLSGEDVKLLFEDSLLRNDKPVALAPLVLRKR